MVVPRIITVDVDSREKYPHLFPSTILWHPDRSPHSHLLEVRTHTCKLDAGDYRLADYPDAAGIERKGSAAELCSNLYTADYTRFLAALTRFNTAFRVPYLLLDAAPADLWKPVKLGSSGPGVSPACIWDTLCRTLAATNIRLLWAGGCKHAGPRRILGEQITRLLLAHALSET